MRKPNGYGSIKKLSGKRRRPYVFLISTEGKQKPLAYFATQVEAEIYAADYNKKHNNKILHGHQITFSELYYRWLPFHIDKYQPAKTTVNSYKVAFQHCLPLYEMPLKSIKYYHLQQIIDDTKRKGLSYSSCKKIRSLISLMFKYGIIMEYCNKNYANLLNLGKNKAIRPHKPFTRQKINKLWSSNIDVEGIDTVLILIYTGMRIGELLELSKDNVYLRQKYIKITKSKTKSGLRVIPIHEKISPLITKRMNMPGKYLICDSNGNPYNYSKYRTFWNKIMQQINAKRRILGHATGDVTDTVYTHKNLKQLRKAINKIK